MIKTKIEDLELDLQQAVENEDYDKAGILSYPSIQRDISVTSIFMRN